MCELIYRSLGENLNLRRNMDTIATQADTKFYKFVFGFYEIRLLVLSQMTTTQHTTRRHFCQFACMQCSF